MRTARTTDIDAAAAEWIGRVQPLCPEEVLAACPFAPPRNEFAGRAAGLGGRLAGGLIGGFLAHRAERALNSHATGGLPPSFVLAITPTHVRAYESSYRPRGAVEMGGEVAAWERRSLHVTRVHRGSGGLKTNVELQLPDGRTVMVTTGTHEYTDRFIAQLQGG